MSSDEEQQAPNGGPVFNPMAGGNCEQYDFLDFPQRSMEYRRFAKFRGMRVRQQRALCWDALRECDEEQRARGIIGENNPWDRMFFYAAGPSYRPMVVEFLSTFIYRPRPAEQPNSDMDDPMVEPPPAEVTFCLFGERQNMSLRQFALATGFYTDEELVQDIYTTAITSMPDDQLLAWWPTLCDVPFGHKARVSLITDPLVRYIHRCIATSISGRGKSNEWVTKNDLFYLYCLFTGTPCALHRCLAEYFASFSRRQKRGGLHGGAFITRIAQHCGRYFPFIGELPPPAPFEYLGIRTMRGMNLAVNFPGIGYRFVGENDQIFVAQPLVHQHLLDAAEVDMPHVVDEPVGEGDVEPEVEQGHPQEPPQHPRRVYHAVRLPQSTQRLLERLVAGQTAVMGRLALQDRRMDRMEDMMEWMMASEADRRSEAGLPVRDPPQPRVYPGSGSEAGPSGTQAGPSGTQASPSGTQAGPSDTQMQLIRYEDSGSDDGDEEMA